MCTLPLLIGFLEAAFQLLLLSNVHVALFAVMISSLKSDAFFGDYFHLSFYDYSVSV